MRPSSRAFLALLSLVLASAGPTTTTAQQPANVTAGNPLELSPPRPDQIDLRFNLTSGGYDNYFIRSNLTSAQLLVTNATAVTQDDQLNRFLVAFPAGNSGAVVYFLPLDDGHGADASGSNSSTDGNATATAAAGADKQPLTVTLVPDSLRTAYGPNDLRGVAGSLELSTNATLGTTLLGSVRTLRDYVEGNGLTNPLFNWTVTQADESTVWFSRAWLNDTILRDDRGQPAGKARFGLEWLLQANEGTAFNVTPSNNGTYTPPRIEILVPAGAAAGGSVNFTVQTNETNLDGLAVDQLFSDAGGGGVDDGTRAAQEQVSFLTFSSKFTAGAFRFLTYFGRDTLVTARLLMNHRTLTPFGVESVLSGVLERINATSGQVCHEETIGDYATFVNLNEGHPELGNAPFYDYKMKDTHYLLLPQLADYLLRFNATAGGNGTGPELMASDEARRFLERPAVLQNGTTYRDLLDANRYDNLARIQQGVPVGNWRDSNPGLGWGVYPYDVSTALVPAALYAISDLAASGLLTNRSLADEARALAEVWEQQAPRFFEVDIPADQVEPRLEEYVQLANLSTSLLYGNGSLNSTAASEAGPGAGAGAGDNVTARARRRFFDLTRLEADAQMSATAPAQLRRQTTGSGEDGQNSSASTAKGKTIYALSLLEDGTPVPVLHSDLGFNLVWNRNVSRRTVEAVVEALSPFPRGLLTNVGMLIANPAYDVNRTKTSELDRTAYHGTVSWGFQTALQAAGIERVLASCAAAGANDASGSNSTTSNGDVDAGVGRRGATVVQQSGLVRPEWCDDADLVRRVQEAQTSLWNAINGAYAERFAEVWSWTFNNVSQRFDVTPLGELSPEGTESNAVQLWSYGLLGLEDPTRAAA
ncbi:uncharacterized protein PFL1_05270 [Pseudozyma flocculosa PF-1]|uniref:Glycogen debranching enzyme n=1 Tax=Pseudozyma flocculosa PF-1 TaxID=1277687 RepID=A0A061H4I8_9BASI|nr:uncharacterized protein PFL1_05270 [Pseudozyma flocculosa PF-1]EPQ27349.1 hypothetical protein PFL1_05270 [Pseudozyma flocculosa PF-1]